MARADETRSAATVDPAGMTLREEAAYWYATVQQMGTTTMAAPDIRVLSDEGKRKFLNFLDRVRDALPREPM